MTDRREAADLSASTRFSGRRWLFLLAACALCWNAASPAGSGEVSLRASQVGYCPDDPKNAVAFATDDFDGTFRVLDADSGQAV